MMNKNFVCLNPDYKKDIEEKLQRQFFMKHIGFDLDSIELGKVVGSVKVRKHICSKTILYMAGLWLLLQTS